MAVISISIEASVVQIMAGIPKLVSITTNIPALIFYTLDGSAPDLFSTQYTGPIFLPTDKLTLILNILATNGTDFSPVMTETYQTNMVDGNVRFGGRNNTNAPPGSNLPALFPFGDNGGPVENLFGNPADVGITVNNPALPSTPTGYDGQGNPTGYTNQPFDLVNYNIRYSTTDAEGQTGPGIGNLPANFTSPPSDLPPMTGPEQTNQFSNTFDPRAFVIFQDLSKEDPNDPPQINRMSFTMEDQSRVRDGDNYFTTGLEASSTTGSFVRSEYNARTGNITYYYYDNTCCKWLISTQPFTPNANHEGNLSGARTMQGGAGKVFEWIPFQRRVLF
jgi:chitobiase/beta-hexosaminidase-like protein